MTQTELGATLERTKLFIGGEWVAPGSDRLIDVINPATEEVFGRVPDGTAEDAERAVAAARAAFPAWREVPPADRAALCTAVAGRLKERGPEVAELISREVGTPLRIARPVQAGLPTATFASMASIVEGIEWELRIGNALVVREPVGVVGAITPWNYPLHQVAAKVAPAIAAGCTVVLKPSDVTPLNAFLLADVLAEVGLPAGVVNVVTGPGKAVGEAIAGHPDVDLVSFTGSTAVGRRVGELAGANLTRVALELGGKSANVILDDADLARAVKDGMNKCFLNSGQTCSALTRMLVPRSRLAEVEAIAKAVAEGVAMGDPLDPTMVLGPLVSASQRDKVREYIRRGEAEGARLVAGGMEPPAGLKTGYYVRPTVFSDVTNDMTIAREEIFGPVLAIIPYDTEEDAVRIADDSDYGLAGGVWSGDQDRALRVARRIRTGQVEINGGAFNALAPFGGFKNSGHGRELGRFGVEEFLTVKALLL
jgi:acyl-CoA reductase-like NAD-dependent aldehyde dehydrogenase